MNNDKCINKASLRSDNDNDVYRGVEGIARFIDEKYAQYRSTIDWPD